jgi:putative transposase
MNRSYRKTTNSKYDLKVHIIWVTKYRYNVLVDAVKERIRDLLRQIRDANDIQIIRGMLERIMFTCTSHIRRT